MHGASDRCQIEVTRYHDEKKCLGKCKLSSVGVINSCRNRVTPDEWAPSFQRCSLCHLAKTFGAGGSKYCCVASLGPDLSGRLKDVTPDQEEAVRAIILNGGPTYMPSWKYGLTPGDIDDIIAYLKTLG